MLVRHSHRLCIDSFVPRCVRPITVPMTRSTHSPLGSAATHLVRWEAGAASAVPQSSQRERFSAEKAAVSKLSVTRCKFS